MSHPLSSEILRVLAFAQTSKGFSHGFVGVWVANECEVWLIWIGEGVKGGCWEALRSCCRYTL